MALFKSILTPTDSQMGTAENPKKKRKTGRIILISIVALFILIAAIGGDGEEQQQAAAPEQSQTENSPSENQQPAANPEEAKTKAKELDAKVYDIVLRSEQVTELLQESVMLASEGQLSMLELYDIAKEAEAIQQNLYYELPIKDGEGSFDYVTGALNYIVNGQTIASNLKKYIDKEEMKYLSSAKESMENTQAHILNVVTLRMKYLSSQGFTDDEVLTLITPAE